MHSTISYVQFVNPLLLVSSAIEVTEHFTLNQSRTEEITLKEDYGNNFLIYDDNFGKDCLGKVSIGILKKSCCSYNLHIVRHQLKWPWHVKYFLFC